MKDKKIFMGRSLVVVFVLSGLLAFSHINGKDKKDNSSSSAMSFSNSSLYKTSDEGGKKGDSYRMLVNNINLPLDRTGVIAAVQLNDGHPADGLGATIDGINVIFSAGFYIGGLHDGTIWGAAQASASRNQHMITGTYESGPTDPRAVMYVLKKSDGDFHSSWNDWKDAVDLGAKFYDGDGDGIYNPIDKNGNGKWDPDEDRPDLLGDETAWCVYNDSMDAALRGRYSNVDPKGIEFRQTVFGYASKGSLGNIVFVRYEILNTGLVAQEFDSVYFSVWADADVGQYDNDLIGCDVNLNAGFTYDNGPDESFGPNSPTFLIDFFQGPVAYVPGETFIDNDGNGDYSDGIDTPLDTAYLVHGQARGVEELPGAKNLGLSSFMHYIQSHATIGDPNDEIEAYNYLRGFDKVGNAIDPCTWEFGEVRGGVDCNTVNNKFWYSGDPVTDVGWICSIPQDQRQMSNTGPFKLVAGETIEIVAAYVIGRAGSSIESVTLAKKIDLFAQFIYDQNFKTAPPPPAVHPTIITEDNAIELVWETADHLNFQDVAYDEAGNIVYDVRFEGFEVYMFNSNSTAATEAGKQNSVRIASYDVANDFGNILIEDGGSGERVTTYIKGTQLDPNVYSNSATGRIRLRIETDPFTNGPLIQGKPYYMGISAYAVNYNTITKLDPAKETDDKYFIPATAFIGITATLPSILGDGPGIITGSNKLTPFRSGVALKQLSGASEASASYSVYDRAAVKSNQYEVSFFKDSLATTYSMYYKVVNSSTGEVVLDSLKEYDLANPKYLADGVLVNLEWVTPKLLDETTDAAVDSWLAPERTGTGALYLASDIDTAMFAGFINNTKRSEVTTFEKTRKVEIRFGQPSMAYRFVKRSTSIRYLSPDPEDPEQGSRFAQVPFSAWVKDDKYGEERQLAVAFLEKIPGATDSVAYNDEKWNPGSDISESTEYFVVFNSPYIELSESNYDPVYTGTGSGTNQQKFADIGNGYRIKTDDPDFTITDEQETRAKSAWFDAMYVVALETKTDDANFNPTGTYTINVNYPLTVLDKYVYTPSANLSASEKQKLFDKVNVYPNPLFGYNVLSTHGGSTDSPFVTFINVPEEVDVSIYSLAGTLVRTLDATDKSSLTSPYLKWNLENEDGLRVASGMYIAIVSSPGLGEKVLKFAIIMPQKQITRF